MLTANVNITHLDFVCWKLTRVLHEHNLDSVEDIPEYLIKQVLVNGDTTKLEAYLDGPVFFADQLDRVQEANDALNQRLYEYRVQMCNWNDTSILFE